MLHKEIPFLRIGLPVCAGIVTGLYINPDTIFLVIIFIALVPGFCFSFLLKKTLNDQIFGYTLTLALFICGLLLYTNEINNISTLKPEEAFFFCTLEDFPEEKANSNRMVIKLKSRITSYGYESVRGSLIIYNKKDYLNTSFLPGDQIILKCTPVEFTNRGNPYEFDYKFYMKNQGIRYYAFTTNNDIIRHSAPPHRKLRHRALILRDNIIGMYRASGITGEKLAVVAAITMGQKNMLDPEQKQNFIKAGVIHIMAVSGLHAGILSLFVFNLLFFLKGRFNILRVSITIIILWSFAFVTGLTPSVMRATMMFSFLQAGKIMNRPVNGINTVLASAFVLILIKPSSIFDTGFLLSFSAVIYIISFYKDLYLKLHFKNWLADKIWQTAVVTIVAQAGTLPLTIMLFNRFPLYFILTNILIVPLSSMLIITACFVIMTFPAHHLSLFLASLLNYLTGITGLLTEKVSALPYSSLENIGMSTVECLLLTLTIYISSYFILKKRSISIILPLIALALCITAGTVSELSIRRSNELIVFNTPGMSTIGIRTGKILNIYSDTSSAVPEIKRYSATLGLRNKTNILQHNIYCLKAGEKRIVIANSPDKYSLQTYKPDILIIKKLDPDIEKTLSSAGTLKALIITSEATAGFHLQKGINTFCDTVHIVRKSGAYLARI